MTTRDHDLLLAEIVLRLTRAEMTEGLEFAPCGAGTSDAWGAHQWVQWTDAKGQTRRLRVSVDGS